MAHGEPTGYIRLYDSEGHPVDIRADSSGRYSLAVADEKAEEILDALRQSNDLLHSILLQLSAISGNDVGLNDGSDYDGA